MAGEFLKERRLGKFRASRKTVCVLFDCKPSTGKASNHRGKVDTCSYRCREYQHEAGASNNRYGKTSCQAAAVRTDSDQSSERGSQCDKCTRYRCEGVAQRGSRVQLRCERNGGTNQSCRYRKAEFSRNSSYCAVTRSGEGHVCDTCGINCTTNHTQARGRVTKPNRSGRTCQSAQYRSHYCGDTRRKRNNRARADGASGAGRSSGTSRASGAYGAFNTLRALRTDITLRTSRAGGAYSACRTRRSGGASRTFRSGSTRGTCCTSRAGGADRPCCARGTCCAGRSGGAYSACGTRRACGTGRTFRSGSARGTCCAGRSGGAGSACCARCSRRACGTGSACCTRGTRSTCCTGRSGGAGSTRCARGARRAGRTCRSGSACCARGTGGRLYFMTTPDKSKPESMKSCASLLLCLSTAAYSSLLF